MPPLIPYNRSYSFIPTPIPGVRINIEFDNVSFSLNGAINAIKDIRRDDGKLRNEIVTLDSLSPRVRAGIGVGALEARDAAQAAQAIAEDARDDAVGSAAAAATSAIHASSYFEGAQLAQEQAAAAAVGAQTARDFAAQWSSAPQDQDVNDGVNPVNKSAYHWAQVALGAATGALPDNSVSTSKIIDLNVTTAKLADGAVTRVKLANAVKDELDSKAAAVATENALSKRVRADAAQAFTPAEKGQAIANLGGGVLAGFRDKLVNGDGQVSQRTYTTVADDVYWCDRHYVLTQTAAITPSTIADVADALPSMMRLTQSQATAQRMGNAQILEAAVAKRLRGKKVTLGGKLRSSLAQVIRYAILEWTGTADAPTSDVVQLWTSATYAPGGFFLGSNLAVSAVGSITLAANTITDFSLLADVSSACNNLIVFYWTEGTAPQNSTLDMAWGLVEGDASAEKWPYGARHPQQELMLCQRYYEPVYVSLLQYGSGTQVVGNVVEYKGTKRSAPTIATLVAATLSNASSTTVQQVNISSFLALMTIASTGTSSALAWVLSVDAELWHERYRIH